METKAKYTLVGSFVIAFIAGIFIFVLWLSGVDFKDNKQVYLINFTGSVTGLRVGEAVRFHGIPIGTVKKIAPSANDPEIIQVKVTIDRPNLIRQDSVATIEAQGLTGFSYVQIIGGSRHSPILSRQSGQRYRIIPSRPSRIEEFFKAAPQIVSNLGDLSERFNRVFDDKAVSNISQIFENIASITGDMGAGPESMKSFLTEAKNTLRTFNNSLEKINKQIDPISTELTQTLQALQNSGQALQKTATHLEGILAENRPDIQEFIGTGLEEFSNLVTDTRSLITRMNKILQDLERGPAYYLNKTTSQGYHAQ